jgi:hypothetical protein
MLAATESVADQLALTAAITSDSVGHGFRVSIAIKPPFRETTVFPSTTTSNCPRRPFLSSASVPSSFEIAAA